MPTLKEQFGANDKRQALIDDACRVLDEEVADKGGLSGIAIKGAYKVLQGIRPGVVRDIVDGLLDDFLGAADPIYQEAADKKVNVGSYILQNSSRLADALLAVTDRRVQRVDRAVVKSAYDKLRPIAKKQVESATPRLAKLLEKHAVSTS